jgi:serine/threonine protein phosphatase PrpC
MAKLLAAGEAQGSADALIAAVLAAGAPDDATGIVVAVN